MKLGSSCLGLFVLVACQSAPDGRVDSGHVEHRDAASALDEVCPVDRYVARRSTPGPCAPIGGWVGEKLFGDDEVGLLGKYCLYEWDATGEPDPLPLVDHPGLTAAPDCEAITMQGDDLSAAAQPVLRDMFRARIGRLKDSDLGLSVTTDSRAPVTVAVVDTAPPLANPPQPLNAKHGETMARFVRDIACPGDHPSCVVEVPRVLGLPRWAGGVDLDNGGVAGSFSDVATGIRQAVDDWIAAGDGSKLIVNLSIGWEPPFGGEEPNPMQMKATPAAVYHALEDAYCRGALIVVAAGNDHGICGTDGPLNPGGWETRPAPTANRCINQFGVTNPVVESTGYRPLVYAVGGTGTVSGLMPDTREASLPRLVAPATHAVVGDAELTPPVTGTSVSAAAVSGAAALVWSENPDLTRTRVMQILYSQGTPLQDPITSEVQLGLNGYDVHQLDVCAAVDQACSPQNGSCPLPGALHCTDAVPDMAVLAAAIDAVPKNAPLDVTFALADDDCPASCAGGPSAEHYVQDGQPYACPAATNDPWLHITRPQPDTIACPTCTLDGDYVIVDLHECYDTFTIEEIHVELFGTNDDYQVFSYTAAELGRTRPEKLPLDDNHVEEVAEGYITIKFRELENRFRDPLVRPRE